MSSDTGKEEKQTSLLEIFLPIIKSYNTKSEWGIQAGGDAAQKINSQDLDKGYIEAGFVSFVFLFLRYRFK